MEDRYFDHVVRILADRSASRRHVLQLLAVGSLSLLMNRFDFSREAEAAQTAKKQGKRRPRRHLHGALQAEGKRKKKKGSKKKSKPRRPPCPDGKYQCDDGTCVDPFDECCPGQRLCGNGACIPANQCCDDAVPPLCSQCQKEVCDNGSLVCRPNFECPPGWRTNPDECRCEQCEMICDAETGLCHSEGCKHGEQCIDGACYSVCTDPRLPQLCCVYVPWKDEVDCYCSGAETICFNCGGALCGCVPGTDNCCDPRVHGPHCPAECSCS